MALDSQRAKSIFLAAADRPADARAAFLDEACAGEAELRRRVEHLLAAHDRPDSLPEAPPEPGRTQDSSPEGGRTSAGVGEGPGTVIGPYKLLQQLGEGGMGTVYLAEQSRPVRRLVALKIIKPGMDSRQVLARFEAERQALALMDHPNIARVLDGGTTEGGRPFFVMELVKGVPITNYCDEHGLTPRQRLELFLPVCHAVQHAHQKGIIHRDLKPSNVMVCLYDGVPVPKVIDFGIAKATGQKLTERTMFTEFGQVVGTLEYMSPEQAELNQLDIDTRSDIYSLGVLLYELLTGSTPLDRRRLKSAALLEVLRLIREEEPPRPSTRLSESKEALPSVSAQRQTEPAKLARLVRGELDWIVMKALEKDRGRRYETANGFAMDVQRYLADEPVLACPPTVGYRLRKFVYRHKGPVLAATVMVLLVLIAIVGTTLGLLRARHSEEHAQREAQKAKDDRDAADEARGAAQEQRQRAVALAGELRQELYYAEMNLASQAAAQDGGLPQVAELLAHWQPSQPDLRGWEWYYLNALSHRALVRIPVSSSFRSPVVWSPDGTRLANTTRTGPKIWDAGTGKEAPLVLEKPYGFVGSVPWACDYVAWSPDGTMLAGMLESNFGDVTVMTLWDAVTGKKRRGFAAPGGRFFGWSSDGTYLGIVGLANTIYLLDARNGRIARNLGHSTGNWVLAWSRQGNRLAAADTANRIRVWDADTGKVLGEIRTQNRIGGICWSPDGTRLAGTVEGRQIQIWEIATGKQQLRFPGGNVGPVAWSPDGGRLASDYYASVGIWDAATGKRIATWRGHGGPFLGVAWSPDGTRVASNSDDETIRVWDARQGSDPLSLGDVSGGVNCVSWAPNGKLVAAAHSGGMLEVWDTSTGTKVARFTDPTEYYRVVAWSPDSRRLATAGNGRIEIWDLGAANHAPLVTIPTGVLALAWSPDGTQLVSGHSEGPNRTWDPVTGKCLTTGKDFSPFLGDRNDIEPVTVVRWSSDGTRLARATRSGAIRIWWDTATAAQFCTLKGHRLEVSSLAWSPDGTRLASASRDRTIKVWDATTGAEIISLTGHTEKIEEVAWNPDGTRLASLGGDGVRIWDPARGRQTMAMQPGNVGMCSIAWSPDGLRLAVGRGYGSTEIYDATRGHQLAAEPDRGTTPSR